MAEKEKEKKSLLGLGLPEKAGDPSAWRPSQATRRAEADLSMKDAMAKNPQPAAPRSDANSEKHAPETETAACAPENSAANRERTGDAAAWRPSKVNEERLSSLLPMRARKRLAISPQARLVLAAVFLAVTAYFFVELWSMPEAGELHVVLVIAAVVILLLFASAILSATARRRRRTRGGDDQSILRL